MKGVVFTEFLEMVETEHSLAFADELITAANLPSGGAYAATGRYDVAEMTSLVTQLAARTGATVPATLRAFGRHLLSRFAESHAQFFDAARGSFELLEQVEDIIHVEVRKLYPDAELPAISTARDDAGRLHLHYRSRRGLADLAHGLIEGAAAHYGERVELERADHPERGARDSRFALTRRRAAE